jgi:hypothetical protein
MAALGITVSHAVERPEPRQATAEEVSLLGIQKTALRSTAPALRCSPLVVGLFWTARARR